MADSLICNVTKEATPNPLTIEGNGEDAVVVASGSASVPVELSFEGREVFGDVGADIVFIIDNSGSMDSNDPDKKRFKALLTLIDSFHRDRDALDRVSIVVMQGDSANLVIDDNGGSWRSWSATAPIVVKLMLSGGGGYTPMANAMRKANNFLMGLDGVYKIVILLSDGYPEPDDTDHPQREEIYHEILPQCQQENIIYSTIYLHSSESNENDLLIDIARATDTISDNQQSQFPQFYFPIENTDAIVTAYQNLFNYIRNRLLPRDVILDESLNSYLSVDADSPITFGGSGIDQNSFIGDITLEYAIEQFRQGHSFKVHINELKGKATLSFSVKLNFNEVTNQQLDQGYIIVPINSDASSLSYHHPNINNVGSFVMPVNLTQTSIKFVFGLQVSKSFNAVNHMVNIEVHNLDLKPVKWFQLVECPSSFVEPTQENDNFASNPFLLLYENRIIPHLQGLVSLAPNLPANQRKRILNRIAKSLRQAHALLLARDAEFNRYLCHFSFTEKPAGYDRTLLWNIKDQRGIYRVVPTIPGRGSHYQRFLVTGISHLLKNKNSSPFMLSAPVDGIEMKGNFTLSKYKTEDMSNWSDVLPNPKLDQIAFDTPAPDLFTRTCFSYNDHNQWLPLLNGTQRIGRKRFDPWPLLNSPDIKLFWQRQIHTIGVSVRVTNGGTSSANGSHLKVNSYFIPFTGQEGNPPYKITPPFFGKAEKAINRIDSGSSQILELIFDSLFYLEEGTGNHPVDSSLLTKLGYAIVITTVDITPARGEKVLINNTAIAITQLYMK